MKEGCRAGRGVREALSQAAYLDTSQVRGRHLTAGLLQLIAATRQLVTLHQLRSLSPWPLHLLYF